MVGAATPFGDMEAQLHEMATAMAGGLTDFGPVDYQRGLKELLAAMDAELRCTEIGRMFAIGTVASTLAGRLHAEQGWRQRPESRLSAIRRPIIITGIPRTGTTALHKLLSMDPQFQGVERWLTEAPQPRPPRADWASNRWFQMTVAGLEQFYAAMPEMRKAHDMVADEVDECLEILRQDFVSNRFGSSMHVPAYDRWWRAQSELPSYRRYVDVLRLIGTDEPEKRWLLKNPGHVAQLDCLLEVMPDACIIQTHRRPDVAIPSLCSTLHMARRMFEGDAARADLLGPREIEYWSWAMEKTALVRARKSDQFHDVDHREFHRDPMAVLRRIYERFDLHLSNEAASRMQQWIAASPTTKHGEHLYDIADYGISRDDVNVAFAAYIDRHSLA